MATRGAQEKLRKSKCVIMTDPRDRGTPHQAGPWEEHQVLVSRQMTGARGKPELEPLRGFPGKGQAGQGR